MSLIYCVFPLITAERTYTTNSESLKLRFENKDLWPTLKESETKYQTLFESTIDNIFLMKGDLFIEFNPMTLRMFGCPEEQMRGHTPFEFRPARQSDGRNSKEKGKEFIAAALAGENQTFEWPHSKLDDSLFDAEMSLTRWELSDDAFALAIILDITDRKRVRRFLGKVKRKTGRLSRKLKKAFTKLIFLETWFSVMNPFAEFWAIPKTNSSG